MERPSGRFQGNGVVEEGDGRCWGPREPPDGLFVPCLGLLHAIDITAVIYLEGTFLFDARCY